MSTPVVVETVQPVEPVKSTAGDSKEMSLAPSSPSTDMELKKDDEFYQKLYFGVGPECVLVGDYLRMKREGYVAGTQAYFNKPNRFPSVVAVDSSGKVIIGGDGKPMLRRSESGYGREQLMFWVDAGATDKEIQLINSTENARLSGWKELYERSTSSCLPYPGKLFLLLEHQDAIKCHNIIFESPCDFRLNNLIGEVPGEHKIFKIKSSGIGAAHFVENPEDVKLPYHGIVLSSSLKNYSIGEGPTGSLEGALATAVTLKKKNDKGETVNTTAYRELQRCNKPTRLFSTANGKGRAASQRVSLAKGGDICDDVCVSELDTRGLDDPWLSRTMFMDFKQLRADVKAATSKVDNQGGLIELVPPSDPYQTRLEPSQILLWLVLTNATWLIPQTTKYIDQHAGRLKSRILDAGFPSGQIGPLTIVKDGMTGMYAKYLLFVSKAAVLEIIGDLEYRTKRSQYLHNLNSLRLHVTIPSDNISSLKKHMSDVESVRDAVDANPSFSYWAEVEVRMLHLHKSQVAHLPHPSVQLNEIDEKEKNQYKTAL